MKWITKTSKSIVITSLVAFCIVIAISSLTAAAVQEQIKQVPVKLSSIKSITVAGDDNSAELIIKLSAPATYTSYKTTAPLRLVLDISQASHGAINAPLFINKGNFKTVTATRFDTDAGVLTRVDIELNKDAEAIITASAAKPGELRISFPSLSVGDKKTLITKNAVASESLAINKTTDIDKNTNVRNDKINTSTAIITSLSANNNIVKIEFDSNIPEYTSFRLNKPERYVIDLMATKSNLQNKIIPLNASGIASARIGVYPDKTRIVFDSIEGVLPEVAVNKGQKVLELKISDSVNQSKTPVISAKVDKNYSAEVIQTQKTDSPAKQMSTPVVSTVNKEIISVPGKVIQSASVEMVDFQVLDKISRVAIKVSGNVIVDKPIKSPGFITVTIKNATINKALQRSLDAQSFVSPVLRITPLQVKTTKGFDTKIRIAMRVPAQFEFRQEGDVYYVDIVNPEGLAAELSQSKQDPLTAKPAIKPSVSKQQSKESELAAELTPSDSATKQTDSSRGYKGRKVTLEFADAEVRKIFQLLSEVSNKNFVLGDDVTGTISIKLVNVPWDQALDIILDTKGLDKREDGNIIIIKGKGKFKSQAEEEQELKKALTKAIELKTETFSINYSDINSIVSQFVNLKTERGTISQDARTNKIIVKDIPQALDDMRKLIVQLDVPEKQVMIEARIVEATSTFTRSLGVNWGIHYRDGSASFMGINQLDTSFGGLASTPAPTSGLSGAPGGSMGISFGTLGSNVSLDLRLNAAASAGLVKIVSTPKVATLNNKTAKITQGQQVPYTSSTSDKVETKFVEAALSLEVTPHINANGTIGMKIDAKNDSVGQATGGSTAPAINKKQATTEMLLRDGETTVIGGIYVDSDNESDDGVPYLMDIPFLGKLFKSNQKTKVKTELLIFITPRILNAI